MKNIVITGMGIRSCIGNTYSEVLKNLQAGKSGITKNETYSKMGFRSQVAGSISIELSDFIDRKLLRFMGEGSAYSYLAALDALEMAGLDEEDISSPKVGIVAGSGGASTRVMVQTADIAREKGPKRIGPYAVTKSMGSSISAILGTALKLKGINYSISSACATSAHCIGHAAELIKSGQQDIVLAGGGEDEHWSSSSLFDAMGALSSNFNNSPTSASRPYDKKRDGFVISGGAGIVVLESEEFAKKRGANILAKLEGYFATSDGYDMVAPSGEGAKRCMEGALKNLDSDIDYINTHGTSTPVGDIAELNAIKDIFKQKIPSISSTKSMTGHSLGATGVHETIFSIMMLREGFIAPSINIHDLCDEAKDINVITEAVDQKLNSIMSNSFGFGGTNASLILNKY
ncbi:MAG: beta-ketoacyl-ACP synthase I [SAR86 cluster bacterium]|jgi:3-oxoacyl-[acyl-carrier-protein] synthase-1|nr:MAG: beta-ketoacyl-ACP synthase I [SAR86 cluster bacterium]|tara:strand:- start:144 stop:1352 length:1209 start_codon:yes stop_codon:yes gene_type:complete